jgi:hypothetical protein
MSNVKLNSKRNLTDFISCSYIKTPATYQWPYKPFEVCCWRTCIHQLKSFSILMKLPWNETAQMYPSSGHVSLCCQLDVWWCFSCKFVFCYNIQWINGWNMIQRGKLNRKQCWQWLYGWIRWVFRVAKWWWIFENLIWTGLPQFTVKGYIRD